MKTAYIDVDGYWGVVIVYNYDKSDAYDLEQIMKSFNMKGWKIEEAMKVLMQRNTGMTITRNDIRMSIVFISNATSKAEWFDTLSHEFQHVCVHIIDYYDEPYDMEGAAYLQGFLMRRAIEEFG